MRVALLGLGLIGGSIARALRGGAAGQRSGPSVGAPPDLEASWSVVAWTPTGTGPAAAVAAGFVDRAAPTLVDAVAGADLVVLAAPPAHCLTLLGQLGEVRGRLAPDAVVTDVASTKTAIVHAAERAGLPFVGGHPMAGAEATGFAASTADLFRGRPWVVVGGATSPKGGLERVEVLARGCGARPVRLSAEEHDRAVAAISHVPLVVAVALVEAVVGTADAGGRPDWPLARDLASTGWASMTRLALGSPEMGAGIAATNAPAIVERLQAVRAAIDGWIALLQGDVDHDILLARFAAARDALAGPDPTIDRS